MKHSCSLILLTLLVFTACSNDDDYEGDYVSSPIVGAWEAAAPTGKDIKFTPDGRFTMYPKHVLIDNGYQYHGTYKINNARVILHYAKPKNNIRIWPAKEEWWYRIDSLTLYLLETEYDYQDIARLGNQYTKK